MAIGIGVLAVILVLAIAAVVVFFGWPVRGPSPRVQAAQALHQAEDAVDRIFSETRIAMEEAAGRRRPGERRFRDIMRGSWQDW